MPEKLTFNVADDFGADNTGQSDCTEAIDRAVKAASGHLGASIRFPSGIYRVSRTIDIPKRPPGQSVDTGNLTLAGDGADSTLLIFTSPDPTRHAIATDVTAFNLLGIKVSSGGRFLGVDPGFIQAQTTDDMEGYRSGAGLYYTGLGNLRVRDVTFDNFMTGLHVNNGKAAQIWVGDCNFNNCVAYGLFVETIGGNAFFERLEITGMVPGVVPAYPEGAPNPRFSNSFQSVGMRINRGDSFQVSDCITSGCGKASLMLMPTRRTPGLTPPEDVNRIVYAFFTACQFDLPFNSAVSEEHPSFASSVIVDGSLSVGEDRGNTRHITRVKFTGCTATAATNNGFYFRNASRVDLTGCSAYVNGTHGVRADGPVEHLSIVGGQYYNNSTLGAFTHDGIYCGEGVTDFLVASVKAGLAPGEKQKCGINASAATCTRYLIQGNEATGYPNRLGILARPGPDRVVANNLV